jgi:hypothetical protein
VNESDDNPVPEPGVDGGDPTAPEERYQRNALPETFIVERYPVEPPARRQVPWAY